METSELAVQDFFQRPTGASGWGVHRIAPWVMLPLGLIGLWTGRPALAIFLILGLLSIYMVSWARKNPIVRLSPEHLEVKAAPLASLRVIPYEEIDRLEVVSPTRAKLWLKAGGTQVLPFAALEPEQRTALTTAINARLGSVS